MRVTGSMILNEACHIMRAARELRRFHGQVEEADVLLVLACGAGAQSISDCTDKTVLTGVDPMFLGNVRRYGQFEEKCSLCGDCLLNESAGICPVTTCAKGLLKRPLWGHGGWTVRNRSRSGMCLGAYLSTLARP